MGYENRPDFLYDHPTFSVKPQNKNMLIQLSGFHANYQLYPKFPKINFIRLALKMLYYQNVECCRIHHGLNTNGKFGLDESGR